MSGWRAAAECARTATTGDGRVIALYAAEDWFPVPTDEAGIAYAKGVCNQRCPVRDECLRAQMDHEGGSGRANRFGVFGGLTGDERESLYRSTTRRAARERRPENGPRSSTPRRAGVTS